MIVLQASLRTKLENFQKEKFRTSKIPKDLILWMKVDQKQLTQLMKEHLVETGKLRGQLFQT